MTFIGPSEYAAKVVRNVWISLDTIATIVNLACLTFLFWFRNKPIVAMGQHRLLAVMCVGSFVVTVGSLIGTIGQESPDPGTRFLFRNAKFILLLLGDFAVDVILFLKLDRAYKVMRFRGHQQNDAPTRCQIIVPFVVLLLLPPMLGSVYVFWFIEFQPYLVSAWLLHIALLVFAWILRKVRKSVWILRDVKETVRDTRIILQYVIFESIIWCFYWVCLLNQQNILEAKGYSDALWIITSMLFVLPRFLHAVGPAIFFVFPRMYFVLYERVHGHLPGHVQTTNDDDDDDDDSGGAAAAAAVENV